MVRVVRLVNWVGFVLLCMAAVFVHSHCFTDSHIVPKWLLAGMVLAVMGVYNAVFVGCGQCVLTGGRWMVGSIGIICGVQAVYGLLQFAGLASSYMQWAVTGSFDNPAGFAACLCGGLPFVGLWLQGKHRYVRVAGRVMAGVMVLAVVLSASRAGVASMAVAGLVYLFGKVKRRGWRYVGVAAVCCLFAVCYWLKKDSADGRLLIWRCSLEMVKDAPLLGHGLGGFEAHYMDYQAQYFNTHTGETRFSMLADNVKHPFNEYLKVCLDFGLAGLSVLGVLIVCLFRCYEKSRSSYKRMAAYTMLSIGVFALFSYPFNYPFTWVIILLCFCVIVGGQMKKYLVGNRVRYLACLFLLVVSWGGGYLLVDRIQGEMEWKKASDGALSGKYREALPMYAGLEEDFSCNPYFLYNYAAVLQAAGQYEESQCIARRCRRYWADYDLEVLMGDNFRHLGDFRKAESYYREASCMCPSRFLPLYKLYGLYREAGDERRRWQMAEKILNKSIKIRTKEILIMRARVKREYKEVFAEEDKS